MQSQFLPKEMFTIFETLMYEETRHIVFFVNWMAYNQAQKGFWPGWRCPLTDFRYYMRALGRMVGTAKRGKDLNDGKEFTATQASRVPGRLHLPPLPGRLLFREPPAHGRVRQGIAAPQLPAPVGGNRAGRHAPVELPRQAAACLMKWAPKIGVAVALLAGVVAAVYLVWSIGFDACVSQRLLAPVSAAWRCCACMRWWFSSAWHSPRYFAVATVAAPSPRGILYRPAGARSHCRDFAFLAGRRHGRGGDG